MIELWTHTESRHYQRLYGTLNAALAAARKELESGNKPDPHADPSWNE